ncbi:hypothetical protein ABI59_15300 [Acidobacteria bacterium Mor1]|nr:hypothetical protein ABI59_15300 [Acidobacteria bacterium Mor1]
MAQAALRPSKNLGWLLRALRKARGWTLREVSERVAARGEPLPQSTLVQIEQGKLEPGVRRFQMLMRLFDASPEIAAHLVDCEVRGVLLPESSEVIGMGFEAACEQVNDTWKAGEFYPGFATYMVMRHTSVWDEAPQLQAQRMTLQLATAARNAGFLDLARFTFEQVMRDDLHPDLTWRALVLGSMIWRALASPEIALALVERASNHLKPDDHTGFSVVLHQEAVMLLELGEARRATARLKHALRHYEETGNERGRALASILLARALLGQRKFSKAREAAAAAVELAAALDNEHTRLSAEVRLGEVLVESGKPLDALPHLLEALSGATRLEDESLQFDAHYQLWRAYDGAGQPAKALRSLEKAQFHAEFGEVQSRAVDEVRAAFEQLDDLDPKRGRGRK